MKRYSQTERLEKLERLEGSGLSRAAFCRREGLCYATVGQWLKKRHRAGPSTAFGPRGAAGVQRRSLGFDVVNTNGAPTTIYDVDYAYYDPTDSVEETGRLKSVTFDTPGTDHTFTYGYVAEDFGLPGAVASVESKSGSTVRMTATKTWDLLGRLESIEHAQTGTGAKPTYEYWYNSANQRDDVRLETGEFWDYGYDELGQLDQGIKRDPGTVSIWGYQFTYVFDDIGNRKETYANGLRENYTGDADNLNQYAEREVPGAVPVYGTADAAADVFVEDTEASRYGEMFFGTTAVDNSTEAFADSVTVRGVRTGVGGGGEDAIEEKTVDAFVPKDPEVFTYDADGNLTEDGRWTYSWNAMNRLVAMETRPEVVTAGAENQAGV